MNHNALPSEILQQIMAYPISEIIHETLVFCGAFAVLLARFPPEEVDMHATIERDLYDDMRFRPIFAFSRINSSYRAAVGQVLLRICPIGFRLQDAPIDSELRLPNSFKNKNEQTKRKSNERHTILDSICSLYDLGVCCLVIGTAGIEKLADAEETFGSLRALDPIQDALVARVYLLMSRLRITLHSILKAGLESLSLQDDFLEIAFRDPPISFWQAGLLYEPIHEINFTHFCLRLALAAQEVCRLLDFSCALVFRHHADQIEPALDELDELFVQSGTLKNMNQMVDDVTGASLAFAKALGYAMKYSGDPPRSVMMTSQSLVPLGHKVINTARPLEDSTGRRSAADPTVAADPLEEILKLKDIIIRLLDVEDSG